MSDFHARLSQLSPEAIEEMISTLRHLNNARKFARGIDNIDMDHVTRALAMVDAELSALRWRPASERASLSQAAE